jgi:uncharacterized protein (TIGR02284 family)
LALYLLKYSRPLPLTVLKTQNTDTMETTEKSIDVLNDLIEINNDRVAGFEKAAKDLGEGDLELKSIFDKYAEESRTYSTELSSTVNQLGGEAESGTGIGGDIHRAWIDVKATFTGHDRKSILAECERGEDAIKKAYQSALNPENELSFELTDILRTQQQGITAAHDRIKALRDSAA